MLGKQIISIVALVAPALVSGLGVNRRRAECTDAIELASGNDDLSTFVAALKASDLIPAIEPDTKYTFFLPTNDAFEKLPEGTVESLLEEENKEQLQNVLLNHIVKGKWGANFLAHNGGKKSLYGEELDVEVDHDGNYSVNGVDITAKNVAACNVWVHLIDEVLVPN